MRNWSHKAMEGIKKRERDSLEPCARCAVPYPDWYLHRVIGSLVSGDVCGVCALEITNAIHGVDRRSFGGEMANEALWLARDWRRKHPVLVQEAREAGLREATAQTEDRHAE